MQGYKKLLLSTALVSLLITPAKGQNTDSPYSRYGYGVLNNQAIGASKYMGGISYGVRGLNTNPGNPASYSGVDSLTFIFDMGVSYRKSRLTEGNNNQNDNNGGLDYLAMQFPVSKKLGVSIGLLPFSSVGYSFGATETEQQLTTTKSYSGSGGYSQIYGGVAYEPFKNISVGANISYLFGNSTYNRTLSISGVPSANRQVSYHKLTLNMLKFDFGAQYSLPLNAKDKLIVGVVFSPAVKTSGRINSIYSEYSASSSIPTKSDTLSYTGNEAYTDLPNSYGAGFTWNHNNNLTIGADVTYQTWSKIRYSEYMGDNMNSSNRFNDVWRFNTGFEYVIDPRDRSFMKRVRFRGGLSYSNSYINVLDSQNSTSGYKEYGATIGFGLPIRDTYTGRSSFINIGLEYKNISPEKSNLIKEQYLGVSLGFCLNDLWFLKNKFR